MLLSGLGVPVVAGDLAATADEAVEVANAIGYPVVVKVSSSEIPHKTEIGGLRLGIGDEDAVRDAFAEVMKSGAAVPGAVVDGGRVERQVAGVEMIVGAVRDATFGPIAVSAWAGS